MFAKSNAVEYLNIGDALIELEEEMSMFHKTNKTLHLQTKLYITKALCVFDKFMKEGTKFNDVYREYQGNFFQMTESTSKDIIKDFEARNFQSISFRMD